MKLGIMTWFRYRNYGTALQVTALSEVLKSIGAEPYVIDYIPCRVFRSIPDYSLSGIFRKLIKTTSSNGRFFLNEEKEQLFDNFIKRHLKITEKCEDLSDLENLNRYYDGFICGSDQIWSPLVFNSHFFLDFVKNGSKKIAYSPSLGVKRIDDIYAKYETKKLLADFKYLSVREKAGKKIVENLTSKKTELVLDPTLLLTKHQWEALLGLKSKVGKPYMFVYMLGQNEKHWEDIYTIANQLGLEVKIIPVFDVDLSRPGCVEFAVGPNEFLDLLYNASYVCTDSYHGLLFSVNFKKDFTIFRRFKNNDTKNQNSRVLNLLETFGLEDRLVKEKHTLKKVKAKINYDRIENIIENSRKKSIEYLKNAVYSLNELEEVETQNIYTYNSLCCGCGSCKDVCPVSAINIKMNEQGFYQSFVDDTLCMNCGKCISVCPVQQRKNATDIKECSLFSYKDSDATVLLKSSSGGAAHRISNLLINKGFSIAGCTFNYETQKAEHVLVENEKDLSLFQNSKYMQSDFSKVLEQIRKCNNPVAIFGTPCQIAGAKKLFSDRKDILYIDLICHGVPSYHLYEKYKQKLSTEYGLNPYKTNVVFRYKPMGWRPYYIHLSDGEKSCCFSQENDSYFRMFELGNCYMKSCYECRFREFTCADIRLGDYWGPKFSDDTTGVSMVLSATKNGENIVDDLKKSKSGFLQEQPIDDYIQYQQMSNLPPPVFYDELIEKLTNPKTKMSAICYKYAVPFENVSLSKKEHIKYIKTMIFFK